MEPRGNTDPEQRDDYTTLAISRPVEGVLLLALNRPEAANALNTQMALDLIEVFEGLNLDSRDVRCVVLTGSGDRVFCAGGDLKERKGMSDAAWRRQHVIFERMVRAMLGCPIPVIAAVNGAAYAGGCEIACSCDFIYSAEQARFALTEVTLGIIPGAGGTQFLPRGVGHRRALEIILTGQPFSAGEACEWGLVNRIVPLETLTAEVISVAARIAENAPISIRQAKQAVHRGLQMSLSDGLAFEIEAYNRTVPTDDRREGVLAFNERRPPIFRGQ